MTLQPYRTRCSELTVECGCLLWGVRVVVPNKLQQQVLKELHEGHPGIVRMKNLARSYVWWPGLDSNIEELVNSCPQFLWLKALHLKHLFTLGCGHPNRGNASM